MDTISPQPRPVKPWFFSGNIGQKDSQRNGWYVGPLHAASGPFASEAIAKKYAECMLMLGYEDFAAQKGA